VLILSEVPQIDGKRASTIHYRKDLPSCQILTPSAPVVKLGRANTTSKELLGARISRPSFMTMVKGFFLGGNIR